MVVMMTSSDTPTTSKSAPTSRMVAALVVATAIQAAVFFLVSQVSLGSLPVIGRVILVRRATQHSSSVRVESTARKRR